MRNTHYVESEHAGRKKYLIPLGDVHIGSPHCDKEKFRGMVRWCLENDAWVVLMGDAIENATKESVGAGVYEQIANPEQQIEEFIEIVKPLKKQILGSLTGNHEERTYKQSGIDLSARICENLEIPYLRYSAFLKLKVGNVNYVIYATHGASGAKLLTGKMKVLMDLSRNFEADCYLMGHVHDLATASDLYKYVDLKNKCMKERKRYFVLTGSFLSYENSYAEAINLPPAKLGSPRLRLNGEIFDIHVSL